MKRNQGLVSGIVGWVACFVLAIACDKRDGDETAEDGSTADQDDDDDSSKTEDDDGPGDGCEPGTCCEPRPEDQQGCAEATTPEECAAAQPEDGYGSCSWGTWYPTTIEGTNCMFGAPQGYCLFEACAEEGCDVRGACGNRDRGIPRTRMENGTWLLGELIEACVNNDCRWNSTTGELLEGSPEICACFCDPDFPGL